MARTCGDRLFMLMHEGQRVRAIGTALNSGRTKDNDGLRRYLTRLGPTVGASVTLVGDDGEQRRVRIVGDDEADAAVGDISWASPLARALIGARVGEIVSCHRPAGATEIEILAIHYAQS